MEWQVILVSRISIFYVLCKIFKHGYYVFNSYSTYCADEWDSGCWPSWSIEELQITTSLSSNLWPSFGSTWTSVMPSGLFSENENKTLFPGVNVNLSIRKAYKAIIFLWFNVEKIKAKNNCFFTSITITCLMWGVISCDTMLNSCTW